MTPRCTGEPVSWLRLERYHLGELGAQERARVAEHLASCAACAACLERIAQDDAVALPTLPPLAPRRAARRRWPVRAAATVGALAAAAVVVLTLRPAGHAGNEGAATRPAERVKGDAVAFALVRDDGARIDGNEGLYSPSDRFKAIVTCPPGTAARFDVVVYDAEGASFPLGEGAQSVACGNGVPMAGAFRLTGPGDETVCLVWGPEETVERARIARGLEGLGVGGASLCKTLAGVGDR
jgi:hypothetical protein